MESAYKNLKRPRQTELFANQNIKLSFGGSSRKGNPKIARPFSTKHFMHVVLKSEKAYGEYSLLHFERNIIKLSKSLGRRLGVEIKDIVVMGNHIHLLVKCLKRSALANFLRAFSGILVRKIIGAEKGMALQDGARLKIGEFFTCRPFSRVVAAGKKSFVTLKRYFDLNRLEKLGWSKNEGRSFIKGPSLTRIHL